MPEIPSPNNGLPVPKQEVDSRFEKVAHLQVFLEESEDDFKFICYPSDPRLNDTYWIIHILFDGKLVHEERVDRLDLGSDISHNDRTLLFKTLDTLKQRVNPRLDVHPEF